MQPRNFKFHSINLIWEEVYSWIYRGVSLSGIIIIKTLAHSKQLHNIQNMKNWNVSTPFPLRET